MGESRVLTETHGIPTPSGAVCAATLYWPDGTRGRLPCVVMGAGGTLTRRDGIPDFAERFAAAGVAALSFDYRHWGDSEGEPRRLISVARQLADWRAAVAYARDLERIDADRIAVWGMSSGGGHALSTAAADSRIATVLALVPMADGVAFGLRRPRRRVMWHALRAWAGRRPGTFPVAAPPGRLAFFDEPEALPGFERLAAPNGWQNEASMAWWEVPRSPYRPFREASRIGAPVLVQLGERDAMAPRRAVELSAARAPRGELRRYPIDHFGCFWPEHIDELADDQVEFVRRHLAAG
jgi:alpha-beta hydrolase superfamily lysophospholipase